LLTPFLAYVNCQKNTRYLLSIIALSQQGNLAASLNLVLTVLFDDK
jgi:hypothetical protein